MRLTFAAIAVLATTANAAARDVTATLHWETPAPQGAETVTVVLDSAGQVLAAQRHDTRSGDSTAAHSFTALPRQAGSLQAGLVLDGQLLAQSAQLPLDGRSTTPELDLHPILALGFRSSWACADDTVLTLAPMDDGLRATSPRPARQFLDQGDGSFLAADGTRLNDDGPDVTLLPPDGAPVTCARIPTQPILPITAFAADESWQIQLGLEQAVITLPRPDGDQEMLDQMTARRTDDGALVFDTDTMSLRLSDAYCRLRDGHIPYPVSATLTRRNAPDSSAGCAGAPLRLLQGGTWYVQSLFGVAHGAPNPDLTLAVADGQITGRLACNLYVGQAAIQQGRLSLTDLGTTRLACPTALRNLERRFLDALEHADGFDIGNRGELILRSGPITTLTATRR
ncbi:META domain-containing protein [Roseinatronobacter sp. NSM]|uniref:META domain-containing protein n=1 Tax=Roseinatronobacter sp. NSM TaxID=3457785 RepID=UPI004036CDE3